MWLFFTFFSLLFFTYSLHSPQRAFGSDKTSPYANVCLTLFASLPEAGVWADLRRHLDQQMTDAKNSIERLFIDRSKVTKIGKELGAGAHGSVYSVQTPSGEAVIKFYHQRSNRKDPAAAVAESFIPSHFIQEILGELGIAPRIFGVLPRAEVDALLANDPALKNKVGQFSHAVLMEKKDEVWVYKSLKPYEGKPISRDKAYQRFKYIRVALAELHVRKNDFDYMVTSDGQIFLHDFDSYSYQASSGALFYNQSLGTETTRHTFTPEVSPLDESYYPIPTALVAPQR